jgi:predicted DNA-binding protein with PD1-like motif
MCDSASGIGGAGVKREDLIRDIRKLARKQGVHFQVIPGRGKGSHYRVEYAGRWTTVQAGELTPLHV